MNISPVTFGKKIPIALCRVKDIKSGTFVPATFYELDCQDKEDIDLIKKYCKDWQFKNNTIEAMQSKYNANKKEPFFYGKSKSFYILQKNDDEIIGISQTDKLGPNIKLNVLESSPGHRYKYAGQSMLAALGKIAINEKKAGIYIPVPISSARKFYSDKCGFKNSNSCDSMYLTTHGIRKFLRKIGWIIDLKATKEQNMAV